MTTIDFIKHSLESSKGWVMGLIMDMKDQPLVQPTPKGGNHTAWVVGHMAFGEANLLDGFVLGQPNRFAEWAELFDMGTEPVAEEGKYPPMDELLAAFEEIRAASLAHLETLSEADLDQPSHAPDEMKAFFDTVGACYSAMAIHVAFHGGQVADARRAAGKQPMMG